MSPDCIHSLSLRSAFDEASLHAFITNFLIEVIDSQRPHPDTSGQGKKRRQLSPEQSAPVRRDVEGHASETVDQSNKRMKMTPEPEESKSPEEDLSSEKSDLPEARS